MKLIIFTQTAKAAEPRESTLDNPAVRQHGKPAGWFGHNLHQPGIGALHPGDKLAAIAAVRPDARQVRQPLGGVIATGPPFSVVFTVWLSSTAADGVGALCSWRRTCAEASMNPLPGAILLPAAQIIIDGLPR